MNIVFFVEKSGLYIRDPDKFKRSVTTELNTALINSGNYILGELQKATPVGATANMRRSWIMIVDGDASNGSRLVSVQIKNTTNYVDVINYGRRAAPISLVGMQSLQLWVQRKLGIVDPKKIKQVAFLIARKKKTQDTPGTNFVETTLDAVIPKAVEKIIEPAMGKFLDDASRDKTSGKPDGPPDDKNGGFK